jgi:hypothetical protein
MRTATLVAFLCVFPCALPVYGNPEGDSSGGGSDGEWETSSRFPTESHNPDEKEQKRLRVHWNKAVVGHRTYRNESPNYHWVAGEELTPSSGVIISGTLSIESEDGKSSKPIDWFQGVRVLIARDPKSHPDWTKNKDYDNTESCTSLIEKDGKFQTFVDADRIRRSVGRSEDFQVGISLAVKSGQTVRWLNSTPAMPQSIVTLSIAGPKPASSEMQILNAAPSISGHDPFNATALVRAVNHLQGLDKDKAIAELREFLKMARNGFMTKRDPANIDTSDRQSVLLIIQLLFEPANANETRREILVGMVTYPTEKDKPLWPYYPLAVVDDFPFLVPSLIVIGGVPTPPEWILDWAEKHGKLRAKPLRPTDDPLAAADKMTAQPQLKRLINPPWEGAWTRHEAWQAIADLVKQNAAIPANLKLDDDKQWTDLKTAVGKLQIRWSEKEQKYVIEK